MTLNLERIGKPLCKIEGGSYNGAVVYVEAGDKENIIEKGFTKLCIKGDAKFQQIPNTKTEREILYITGQSGSGKSTYTYNYCKGYKKLYPDRPIYMFSSLDEDPSLDKIYPKRIKLDDTIWKDPIKAEDLADSMVIFDDTDNLSDKKVRDAVYAILNHCLEIGRHYNISVVATNHLPTNSVSTRRILNECNSITYFPHGGSAGALRYMLERYVGVDKDFISRVKGMKTRWCSIFKNYPNICMTEKEIWCLADDYTSDNKSKKEKDNAEN